MEGLDRQRDLEKVEGTAFELAPFWRRLIAGLLDWLLALICGVIGTVLVAVAYLYFGFLSYAMYSIFRHEFHLAVTVFCFVVLMTHMWFGFRVAMKRETLGDRLMRLRVERVDGIQIGYRRSLARQLSCSPFLFVYCLPMLLLILSSAFLLRLGDSIYALGRLGDTALEVVIIWLVWGLLVSAVTSVSNQVFMSVDYVCRRYGAWS